MEEITKYGIAIGFEDALKKLRTFEVKMSKMEKNRENSLQRQIAYQKRLNALMTGGGGLRRPRSPLGMPPTAPPSPTQPLQPRAPQTRKPPVSDEEKERLRLLKEQEKMNNRIKSSFRQQWSYAKGISEEQQKIWRVEQKQAKTMDHLLDIQAAQKRQAASITKDYRAHEKSLKRQSFALQRMNASSRQLAGNMVSAFAVVGTGMAVTRIGQDFEAVNNTMLAVSGSSEQAGENFQFVRDEAFRLGLGLKQSAQGFAKMKAAQGEIADQEMESIFRGVAEASTVLGLTAEEQSRSINAIVQMLSKGKISAEELRLQLGETMPTAIQDMARAAQRAGVISKHLKINDAVSEMLELQAEGKLISSEVLPEFGRVLSEHFGAGLEKALKSNRVAMNRLFMTMQEGSDEFFRAGFAEGLTEFFNTTATSVRELIPLFKSFGRILGSFFKIVSQGVQLITAPLRLVGVVLDQVTEALGSFSYILNTLFVGGALAGLSKLSSMLGNLRVIALGLAAPFFKVVSALVLIEELLNLLVFRDKKGLFFDPTTATGEGVFSAQNVLGEGEFTKFLDTPISQLFGGMQTGGGTVRGPNYSRGETASSVTLKGDVVLDGQKVGEVVAESDAMGGMMQKQIFSFQN